MNPLLSPLQQAVRAWLGHEAPALPADLLAAIERLYAAVEAGHVCIRVPADAAASWQQSGWVGEPGSYRPFIVEPVFDRRESAGRTQDDREGGHEQGHVAGDARFYLARYHGHETAVAASLRQRAAALRVPQDAARLQRDLDALFGADPADRQRLAALLAPFKSLLLVSGGPGTGKTTTVVKLLALLQAQALQDHAAADGGRGVPPDAARSDHSPVGHDSSDSSVSGHAGSSDAGSSAQALTHGADDATAIRPEGSASPLFPPASAALRILLAAPTGKAAQRLSDAIRAARQRLDVPSEVAAAIPETAQTLHRLLGAQGDTGRFRHDAANPLACDLLLIDEASMIDLSLMRAVLDALPADARLILLGDRDQLASVEAGSVFGDLCAAEGMSASLAAALAPYGVTVEASLPSGVLADCRIELTHSYRFGTDSRIGVLARAARAGDGTAFLQALAADNEGRVAVSALRERLQAGYAGYRDAVQTGEVAAAFASFLQFRVLCAHRQGAAGVEGLNALMEGGRPGWYPGRPVIVRANDYALRLFNGDIGLCLPTPDGLRVFFETAPQVYRQLAPGRLPTHEPAWAMTVHQAQGSEFDEVLLVLPEVVTPVLDRPLVYTAVTRARERFALCGDDAVLQTALATRPARESGLAAKLA
ncbi:MAG: exodeoxyribonuclease V subunit alpha [Moraxellaceae bacterium]|nr:exodeoxyribonuclease V subunit alpha [Moraxellaceae bacterium]